MGDDEILETHQVSFVGEQTIDPRQRVGFLRGIAKHARTEIAAPDAQAVLQELKRMNQHWCRPQVPDETLHAIATWAVETFPAAGEPRDLSGFELDEDGAPIANEANSQLAFEKLGIDARVNPVTGKIEITQRN